MLFIISLQWQGLYETKHGNQILFFLITTVETFEKQTKVLWNLYRPHPSKLLTKNRVLRNFYKVFASLFPKSDKGLGHGTKFNFHRDKILLPFAF
jgi:hypothetical protein